MHALESVVLDPSKSLWQPRSAQKARETAVKPEGCAWPWRRWRRLEPVADEGLEISMVCDFESKVKIACFVCH